MRGLLFTYPPIAYLVFDFSILALALVVVVGVCIWLAFSFYEKQELVTGGSRGFNSQFIVNTKANLHLKPKKTKDLGDETKAVILNKLSEFERKKGFVNPVTLASLSKKLKTNSTYLSKTINVSYSKNFSQYLTDLRINAALDELNKNEVFRRYTIKAIAKEVGFGSSEAFSKSFFKKTGAYPSMYIKQLSNLKA